MKFLKMIPIIFIFLGISPNMNLSHAESKNPNEFKVLSSKNKKLSISNVQDYLTEGDKLIKAGDFENYDKARNLARQLVDSIRDPTAHSRV